MKTRLLTPGVSLFALSTSLCSPLILLFACMLFSSCRSSSWRSGDGETGGDLPLYVQATSPSVIPSGSPVRIVFTEALGPSDTLALAPGIFRMSPSVKGLTYWKGGGTMLEFLPREGAMKEGRTYRCTVAFSKFVAGGKDYSFTVKVEKPHCEIVRSEAVISGDDPSMCTLEVVVRFSRNISPGDIAPSCVKVGAGTSDVKIGKGDSPEEILITVNGVRRAPRNSTVDVSYDPGPNGIGDKVIAHIHVPGREAFQVTGALRNEEGEPCVTVRFSDPLSEEQSLEGLMYFEEIDVTGMEKKESEVFLHYDKGESPETLTLVVEGTVRNKNGRSLSLPYRQAFVREPLAPEVQIPISGNILPDPSDLRLPFRAVNLAAVDVEVFKIYAKNVLSFLQVADMNNNYSYYLRRSGRVIYRRTARLDANPKVNLHAWNDFSVDLSGLFAQEKGAIYAIRLSFREEYSLYGRDLQDLDWESIDERVASRGSLEWDDSVQWDDPYNRMYSEDFRWDEREDPTSRSYYLNANHFPTINLTYSSIGVIAKTSEMGTLWVSTVDINSARPAGGVHLTAYNYQLKAVGEGWSDESGHCDMALRSKAHFLVSERGNSVTYLDLSDRDSKNLSSFDVGGKKLEKGLKGYIYGERGVWRPGDEVHLTLVLDGDGTIIPSSHPATLEIYTPEGTLWGKRTLKGGVNGFYCFSFETSPSAPTGRWKAVVSVGGASFSSSIPIETIKPNRLKVDIPDCPPSVRAVEEESGASPVAKSGTPLGTLRARWLSGPPAGGEDVKVDMLLSKMKAPFPQYGDYVFEDPLSDFSSSEHEVFSGKLDGEGKVSLMASLPPLGNVPGPLRATLLAHVSESGGGESLGSRELRYDTFDSYTGVKLLSTQYDTDSDISIPVVVLDREGRVLPGHDIQYRIYRLEWSWWWECSSSELSRYVHGSSAVVEAQGEVRTSSSSSPSNIHFKVDYPDWGHFLLVATDPVSGHTTGGVFTVDWPSWRGRSERGEAPSSAIIPFSLDSDSYEVGTDATVYVPQAEGGVALVSIEDGSQVLQRTWVRTSGSGETPFRFRVTAAMRPNVYVHLTLLQPRNAHLNDLPLRMYGVRKVKVTQKSSVLSPVIDVPASVSPQTEFTIKVRERDSRPMTYTLAIVDEGLLDITGFRTPDPWKAMNEVEALGVKTFDMYDDVVGAYGGKFSSVMKIGGDMALRGARRDNRFNPVVKFMGPFTLQGGSASHKVTLPMYVGSVRVMVVAGYGGAWGSADTTLAVKSPLMVIPTLPRALSCSDRVTMPVNVFMTEKAVKDVEVSISVDGPVKVEGQSTRRVRFTAPGDTLIRFSLICDPSKEGIAGVKVRARSLSGEGLSASDTISISVRNPHPLHLYSSSVVLEGGESRTLGWEPFTPEDGEEGVTLALSTFPSIDFEKTFSFVYSYPHLCTEQLSSRLMNLLFTRKFLSEESRKKADGMIPLMIGELLTRQLYGGGFRYWASGKDPQHWASVMAAQCLLEARRQGFAVPQKAISLWVDYARKEVRSYRHTSRGDLQDLVQAYRLWVLSEAGQGDIGAMNRLREGGDLSPQAVCCLGMAYVLEGKKKVAEELLSGLSLDFLPTAFSPGETFRSRNRDRALMLEALCLLEKTGPALELATDLCKDFAASDPTTQEVGFTSMALSRLNSLAGGAQGTTTVRILQEECVEKAVSIDGGSYTMDLDPGKGSVVLTNASPSGKVYLTLLRRQRPAATERVEAKSGGVKVEVRYFDAKGKSKDTSELRQGEEFFAELTVSELTTVSASSHMALTFSLPHAWEVASNRLFSDSTGNVGDYTDIRDDSVRWYFSLPAGAQKTFRVRIRASYEGDFLLPQTVCEDMYNPRYRCLTEGGRVNVNREGQIVSR